MPVEPQMPAVTRGKQVPPAPRFSIIVPCFNLGSLAREAVQSALDQTVPDAEVIVVDDGSDAPVADELHGLLDRIVLVRKPNGGISDARNCGIALARGRYIVLLDGDDQLVESHCANCLALFDADTDCMAVAPDAWISGESQSQGVRLSDLYPRRHAISFENFLAGLSLVPGCCTFRKEAFDLLPGPYDTALARAEDFLLNAQLLARGMKYRYMGEPTYRYRRRAGSLSFDSPIPLARAVLQALDKLQAERHGAAAQQAVDTTRQRYRTELNFHLFRDAMLARRYRSASEHARAVQLEHLSPARRRWKFLAGRAMVGVLSRVLPGG